MTAFLKTVLIVAPVMGVGTAGGWVIYRYSSRPSERDEIKLMVNRFGIKFTTTDQIELSCLEKESKPLDSETSFILKGDKVFDFVECLKERPINGKIKIDICQQEGCDEVVDEASYSWVDVDRVKKYFCNWVYFDGCS